LFSRAGRGLRERHLPAPEPQYTIEKLDLEDRKAYARPVEVDYYTDAQIKVDLKVLDVFASATRHRARRQAATAN
jgi:ATP-dependent helicase YprA (DUF1998 family)